MKKNQVRVREQKKTSRRLTLSRETIHILNRPELLELARGGDASLSSCLVGGTTSRLIIC